MAIEMSSDRAICPRCGMAYGRRKGNFPVSYGAMYKGAGHLAVCKPCIDGMYADYLSKCGDSKTATRVMCRKLDLYWSESIYENAFKKSNTRSMMTAYIGRLNNAAYSGKSYDDTLIEEESLWIFPSDSKNGKCSHDGEYSPDNDKTTEGIRTTQPDVTIADISDDVIAFWGSGYTPQMYTELEQRRAYWMSSFPDDIDIDIGTEAIIRQICSLELDINRDRAAGRSVEKSITALNTLLGSANLKPVQKKQDDMSSDLADIPLGVWLHKYENERPLPEIDDDLKDVNGILKYVFIWLGHVCKMLGKKNGFSRLYEKEISKYRVERPEFSDESDEEMLMDVLDGFCDETDDGGGS